MKAIVVMIALLGTQAATAAHAYMSEPAIERGVQLLAQAADLASGR